MPFPRVTHCLVCEAVRPEVGGKATILGFYGLFPGVEIRVQDLVQPIGPLCFIIFCEPGTGDYAILPQILGPSGNVVAAPDKAGRVSLADPNKRAGLAFGFGPLTLGPVGTYCFVLNVEGKEHFRASFKVMQGEGKDFL